MAIEHMTLDDIKDGYLRKKFSVMELVQEYLKRIEHVDDNLNAFITICRESALKEAKEMDRRLENGEDIGTLGGIPIAVNDNICTCGIRTTCASRALSDFIPPYDATVVKKLKAAGAIIIGKTNMDEFAMGSSTESSAFKCTVNPWDITRVPGGSSGGSAAAVAAGLAPIATGSDTGGSIRQPASFCGVVGLKPTYGMVSRFGLISFASSFDQVGPITRNVKDCAYMFHVLKGHDPLDSTSITNAEGLDCINNIKERVMGLKIGIPKESLGRGQDSEIYNSVMESIRCFEQMGVIAEEFSMPVLDSALSAYYIISSAEASSNLARYDGIRYGYRAEGCNDIDELIINSRTESFGKEVKRRIMMGAYVLSSSYYESYYKRALTMAQKIKGIYKRAFEVYDLILMPTSPILPFGIGEKKDNPLDMYQSDVYTVLADIAGVPAISLPCGFSRANLPVGLQLIADHCMESRLLQAAYAFEQIRGISNVLPSVRSVSKDD